MNTAGISDENIKEVENVKRKQESKGFMRDIWTVNFKKEFEKKPFIIEVYT